MSFRSPWMLAALVFVPGVVAAYVWSRRQRSRRSATLATQGLVTTSTGAARKQRHVPFVLFAAALTVLIVALARPTASVRTPRREATVVLAMDVSNSMAAADIKPTRFDAAKTAARAFVAKQPSAVRLAVVAFGAGAVTVLEPTTVHADVDAAIDRLSLGGGTSLGQGLISSLGVIAGKPVTIDENALNNDSSGEINIGFFGSATIVVFSDGENLSRPDPVSVAKVASVAGVRIQSVGVGTDAGTVVKIDGFSVATALDSDLLQKVAAATDGSYHQAADAAGLATITKSIDLHFKVVSQHTEITGLFAIAGALLLVVGSALSILWFGRVV